MSKLYKDLKNYKEGNTQCPLEHVRAEDKDFSSKFHSDQIVSCIGCAYGIYHKALVEKDIADKAKWQRFWLKHCISKETNYIFEVLKEVKEDEAKNQPIKIDREESVKKIAHESLLQSNGHLAITIDSEKGKAYYKTVLINWFLQRYNWKDAFLLCGGKKWLSAIMISLACLLPVLFLFFLINSDIKWINNFTYDIPLYVEMGTIIIIASLMIFFLFNGKNIGLMFPRLIGANFIGLLPLITENYTWSFPLKLNWGQICSFGLFTFLTALIYLVTECKKSTTALSCWKVFQRVLPISLYGLFIGLILSTILCDIMAIHFIEHDKIIYNTSCTGIFGLIYPKVIVLFAFCSFLIGIFVQIFWEEKTITESL